MIKEKLSKDNIKALLRMSKEERRQVRETEKEQLYQEAIRQYPNVKCFPRSQTIKYKKALNTYPDLKELGSPKLILLAYDFRQEQTRNQSFNHGTELANARCNIQLGGYKQENIPEDLPALSFEKECVVCCKAMKGISICPLCWQLIRKCIDLKGIEHKEGWTEWGKEWNLDLSSLVRLLKREGGQTFEEILAEIKKINDSDGI